MATISEISPQVFFSAEDILIPINAQSTAGGDLTFEISGGPATLMAKSEERIIVGSADQNDFQEYEVTVTVEEGVLPSAEVTFLLVIIPTRFNQTENLPDFLDESTYPQPSYIGEGLNYYGLAVTVLNQRFMAEAMALNQEGPANMLFRKWWEQPIKLITGLTWIDDGFGTSVGQLEYTNNNYQEVGAQFELVQYYAQAPAWNSPNVVTTTYSLFGEVVATVVTTTTYSYSLSDDGLSVVVDVDVQQTGEPPEFSNSTNTTYQDGPELDPTSIIQQAVDNQRAAYNSGLQVPSFGDQIGKDVSYTNTGGAIPIKSRYESDIAARLPAHGFGIGYRDANGDFQRDLKFYQHLHIQEFSEDPRDPDIFFEEFLGVKKEHLIIEADFDQATLLTDPSGEQFYHVNLGDKIPTLSDTQLLSKNWRADYSDDTTDPAHYAVFTNAIPANTKDWNSLDPSDSYDSITSL